MPELGLFESVESELLEAAGLAARRFRVGSLAELESAELELVESVELESEGLLLRRLRVGRPESSESEVVSLASGGGSGSAA